MSDNDKDEIITVQMPRKDYEILREIIEDRQAMRGIRRFIQDKLVWIAGTIMVLAGCYEALRRLSNT